MRDVNGWVVGAVGAAALVGAFYLGGRTAASSALGRLTADPRRWRRRCPGSSSVARRDNVW